MFLKLRILFTILSAICAAAVIPVGMFAGFVWALGIVFLAVAFFFIMTIFKGAQEKQENKEAPQQPQADFLNPQSSNPSTDKTED